MVIWITPFVAFISISLSFAICRTSVRSVRSVSHFAKAGAGMANEAAISSNDVRIFFIGVVEVGAPKRAWRRAGPTDFFDGSLKLRRFFGYAKACRVFKKRGERMRLFFGSVFAACSKKEEEGGRREVGEKGEMKKDSASESFFMLRMKKGVYFFIFLAPVVCCLTSAPAS